MNPFVREVKYVKEVKRFFMFYLGWLLRETVLLASCKKTQAIVKAFGFTAKESYI